jgi:hypothetical protein
MGWADGDALTSVSLDAPVCGILRPVESKFTATFQFFALPASPKPGITSGNYTDFGVH